MPQLHLEEQLKQQSIIRLFIISKTITDGFGNIFFYNNELKNMPTLQ